MMPHVLPVGLERERTPAFSFFSLRNKRKCRIPVNKATTPSANMV
jgi:hypothetical protein